MVILVEFKNKLWNHCSTLEKKKIFKVGLCVKTYYNVELYIRFPSDCLLYTGKVKLLRERC